MTAAARLSLRTLAATLLLGGVVLVFLGVLADVLLQIQPDDAFGQRPYRSLIGYALTYALGPGLILGAGALLQRKPEAT